MFCNRCGHSNPPGVTFCVVCGALLDVVDPTGSLPNDSNNGPPSSTDRDAPSERVSASTVSAALVVRGGDRAGETFLIPDPLTRVGRSAACEISLDDITVSRFHAEIQRTSTGYLVRDMGSLNGTYLNRERVVEAWLRHDDELQVGKFRFVFVDPT